MCNMMPQDEQHDAPRVQCKLINAAWAIPIKSMWLAWVHMVPSLCSGSLEFCLYFSLNCLLVLALEVLVEALVEALVAALELEFL